MLAYVNQIEVNPFLQPMLADVSNPIWTTSTFLLVSALLAKSTEEAADPVHANSFNERTILHPQLFHLQACGRFTDKTVHL